jgi:hypothetical protein
MKIKSLYAGAIAFSMIAAAHADVTVDITGATAFRQATLNSIKARFDASGAPYKYAHDQATGGFNGATYSIWIGTFPGVSGTTTIRTSFNGSVEGIRALVDSPTHDPVYLQPALLSSTTAIVGGAELASQGSATKLPAQSEIAFSDVSKAATPYSASSLQPANSAAGVVVFTMVGSEGTPLTNITAQQFRALFSAGFQPLSLFTGNAADNPLGDEPGVNAAWIFATGRNDGSGTRTTYLAETGYGVTNPVKQYTVLTSASGAISSIQLVPAGGVNDSDPVTVGNQPYPGQSTGNASTVWGQDLAGNGGYSSGSTLRTDLGLTGNSVTVRDETYADAFGEPQKLTLVSWLSLSDAVTARNNGAVFLAYNGVKLNDIATSGSSMSAADLAKVTNGAYTAWSYQHMYRRNDLTAGDVVTVYNAIRNNLVLGSAGIPIAQMNVGRESDGGTVAP